MRRSIASSPRTSISICRRDARPRSAKFSYRRHSPRRCSTWRTRKQPRARADARPGSPPRATPSIAATSRARSSNIRKRTAAFSQARNLLDPAELKTLGHNSVGYLHRITEAVKLAFADREAYFGDPRIIDVPIKEMLSRDYADKRRGMIRPDKAWP